MDKANYEAFRDNVFASLVSSVSQQTTSKSRGRRRLASKQSSTRNPDSHPPQPGQERPEVGDPSELADFADFMADEIFSALPEVLRNLTYQSIQSDADVGEKWSLPLTLNTIEEVVDQIPPPVTDSLLTYGLIDPPKSDLHSFLSPVVASYISTVTTPPPKWVETKVTACEICDRDWVPITYHHLIPRAVHAKVLKRGWHDESMLNSVAWLCRACHTFVHKMASNEELAKDWFTVERICSRDDVDKWAQWVGRVRWKKR